MSPWASNPHSYPTLLGNAQGSSVTCLSTYPVLSPSPHCSQRLLPDHLSTIGQFTLPVHKLALALHCPQGNAQTSLFPCTGPAPQPAFPSTLPSDFHPHPCSGHSATVVSNSSFNSSNSGEAWHTFCRQDSDCPHSPGSRTQLQPLVLPQLCQTCSLPSTGSQPQNAPFGGKVSAL